MGQLDSHLSDAVGDKPNHENPWKDLNPCYNHRRPHNSCKTKENSLGKDWNLVWLHFVTMSPKRTDGAVSHLEDRTHSKLILYLFSEMSTQRSNARKKKKQTHLCLTSNNKQPATCIDYIIFQKTTSFPPARLFPEPESSPSHWTLHNILTIATSATINTVASLHPALSGF